MSAKHEPNEIEVNAHIALQNAKVSGLRQYYDNSDTFVIKYIDAWGVIQEYGFCPDFVIGSRLIVEIDGIIHYREKVEKKDALKQDIVDKHNKLRKLEIAQDGHSSLLELEMIWRWPASTVKEDYKGFAECVKLKARSMGML